ncbi:MAG: ABC transporter ATP-binding protein [Anaerolineales bacterium]
MKHDDLHDILTPNRLRGLWRLMRGYRLIYIAASFSLGISALSRTGTYLLLQKLIDDVIPNTPTSGTLLLFGLAFVGLAVVTGGFTFISGNLAARTAEGLARRLRNTLFDHIQHLPFRYHDATPTGELIERCTSDVDALRTFFADQVINAGQIVVLFSVNIAAIIILSPTLALRSVLIIPLLVGISFFFFRRISIIYEAYQEQEAVLSTTLQENLSGVRVVKAFARQDFEIQKFEQENWEKYQRGRKLILMHALFWPSSDILSSFQMIVGLGIAALMTINTELSLGSYVAYAGMILWIIWPMRNLGRLIVQMSSGIVSFGRVKDVIKESREQMTVGIEPPVENLHGEIRFKNVSFAYESGTEVLHGIDLVCPAGKSVALLGTTGSGKTTLVNLLPRFYDYTSGSLTLDGIELKEYSKEFLRRNIGIVEQEPFLFSRTIRENITHGVGREVSEDEIIASAKAAAIHETILSFPQGYETLVGERGVTLSGGQKQRVAIARTLLKDPRILILDDSTSSVDMLTELEIRAALERLMIGRTSFVIAHRIQSVMNADQIVVMENGKIVQRGSHTDLIQESGIYREIHQMQTVIESALEEELSDVRS